MTDPQQLASAQEAARRTYDRRRARKAADLLATITPDRWDDATRAIIATLATIIAPSRITDLLDRELPWDMPTPYPSWSDLPELVEDARQAAAADDAEMDERDRMTRLEEYARTATALRTHEETRNGNCGRPVANPCGWGFPPHCDTHGHTPVERCPDHPNVAADVCGVTACMTRRINLHTRALHTGEHPK